MLNEQQVNSVALSEIRRKFKAKKDIVEYFKKKGKILK